MVGSTSQPQAAKETSLTFQCSLLTLINYAIWRMRMEVLLGIHGVWDVVDQGSDDAKKNNIVKGLADRVKETRLQTLITKFENTKMSDNDNIDASTAKLLGIASKSATLRKVKSKHKMDVVKRLKAYEERVKKEDKANCAQKNLLYARTEYSNENNDLSGGKGDIKL
ncbi:hypothetical protein Tco_0601693 [Tanacetum coccineum]